jgi:hypothetical protein
MASVEHNILEYYWLAALIPETLTVTLIGKSRDINHVIIKHVIRKIAAVSRKYSGVQHQR